MKAAYTVFLILLLILSSSLPIYAIDDKIIAIVNDDVITFRELHDHLSTAYMELVSSGKSKDEIRKSMEVHQQEGIDKLIERKLLVDEANDKGLIVNKEAVDQRLQELKDYYGSDLRFHEALSKDGMTVTDLINTITNQIKAQSIIDMEIKSKIFINPREVTSYYQEHTEQFFKPERVDLQSIFIPYEDDKDSAIQQADEISKLLKAPGANFSDLAKQHSQAPSIGIIARGQFLPAIESAVFDLAEGEISEPIKTEAGLYILKVMEKYPEQQAPLDEVRDSISNFLFRQKFNERVSVWLDELKSRAYIEIKG